MAEIGKVDLSDKEVKIDFEKLANKPLDIVDQEVADGLARGDYESEEMGADGKMHPVEDNTF